MPSSDQYPLYNLFQENGNATDQESFHELLKNESVRIERIVSQGQCSPPGFWYDQDEHEWVAVLTGQAVLRVEGNDEVVTLKPGDTLTLPAHTKHRVEWTDPLQPTIWLGVFWQS